MTHQKVRQTRRWTDNLKLNNIRIIMFFQTPLLNFLLCLKSKIRSFIRNFIFLILFFTTLYQLFVRLFNQSSIFFSIVIFLNAYQYLTTILSCYHLNIPLFVCLFNQSKTHSFLFLLSLFSISYHLIIMLSSFPFKYSSY